MKKIIMPGLAGFSGGLLAIVLFWFLISGHYNESSSTEVTQGERQDNVSFANMNINASESHQKDMALSDFTVAAERTLPAVVHIKSTSVAQTRSMDPQLFFDPFGDFFGRRRGAPQEQRREAAGSGVIISEDGYITTNNHVINEAEEIEVTLHDNRKYKAEVIGTDPTTDIALIKIDAKDLTAIKNANSDNVKVGEWVLAVGNPFNLASTATAGIVSAKGRNINILKEKSAVESFIQTDAAVNPGNSGGALVNLDGELIGINTAIATPTGAYAGYSFAVPSNLAAKVVDDLRKYGTVQRAYLGVAVRELNSQLSDQLNLDFSKGVYVDSLTPDGSAMASGIKKHDIITRIDGKEVQSTPQLLDRIARKRPGDVTTVTVLRNGKEKEIEVTLLNLEGSTKVVEKEETDILKTLGASFSEVPEKLKKELGINYGVQISELGDGLLSQNTNIKKGFIITKLNNKPVESPQQVVDLLQKHKGGVVVEGRYPNYQGTYYYAFGLQ